MNKQDIFEKFAPSGHFYSSIPDLEEIEEHKYFLFDKNVKSISGIDLNANNQLQLLKKFIKLYKEQPFSENMNLNNRYYFNNGYFGYGDALTLYNFIRYIRPKQIIEVGSGFSSAVMIDTNEQFMDDSINLTFIEPYPENRLNKLIRSCDSATVIKSKVQDIDLSIFAKLQKNDILFIDSSHVSKTGSDVNFILFHILPLLKKGVYIHFHDILYPFEYPYKWLQMGRAWNESYILRAFLMNNNSYNIELFNNYIGCTHKQFLKEKMPLFAKNPGGSIWLKKIK